MPKSIIDLIRTLAKEESISGNIKYTSALDLISVQKGFKNFHHAKKELLKSGFEIYFCMDIKDAGWDYEEIEFFERPSNEFFQKYLDNFNKENNLSYSPKEFLEHYEDFVFIKLISSDVTNYKQAIDKIRDILFFPPQFLIHNYETVDLSNFSDSDFIRFSG